MVGVGWKIAIGCVVKRREEVRSSVDQLWGRWLRYSVVDDTSSGVGGGGVEGPGEAPAMMAVIYKAEKNRQLCCLVW